MGLQPLEFSDCYLDSPWFRERVRAHEAELDRTNKFIKELLKDGKNLIAATKNLSAAQRKFAHSLRDFKFEFIGDAETDDERYIDASLHEFSNFLKNLEEQREILALSVTETLIKPLERFRKEQLGAVKEEKKKFDKETEKNYSLLEKHLNLSAKKKELQLQEADNQVEQNRKHFYELSLEYVCKLQEIQERKKFECVEPVLSFFQGLFTFYHQGYELAKDFNHYKMALQMNIQNTRNRFEGTRSEVEELMNKIRRNPQEHKRVNHFTMEGYLYVQEKRPAPFGSSWVKHYCTYRKETKKFTMIPFEHRSGGKVGDEELFILTYCTKRNIDSTDRRFCFDLEASDRPGIPVTMQAFSEEDRKLWMEALDGKETLFINLNRANTKREGSAQLDKIGFTIIKKCISAVETRGINDQGLYRVVGVSSKVQRLLNLLMDAKTCNEVDLENSVDWEVKTITSAMKQYLRSLPEPLMTYELHGEFIVPAKSGSPESRVNAVHFLVHKLPEKNKEMLDILVKHLANVSKHAKKNLMTVANLGVVFGPTLMRPQEETVAAIMDLKFQNIVVEILIENHEKIFKTLPDATFPEPISMSVSPPNAPPRQSRRQGQRNKRPLAVYNLCLELDDADSLSSPKEDMLTGSMDSLSSHSPTPAFSSSPPGLLDRNHLIMDSGDLADWTTNHPGQSRSSMVSWMNTPSANAAATNTAPSFSFLNPATASDRAVESVVYRKARAVYPCEAEHSSELSFQIGAIFEDVQFSREPGWLEGTLNGKRGLIPQNYVQFL
ncbi:rho GTPase-activating protein 10 isoform X1 [Apteryx mantelli]|uniref:Rho GTPase-activating protein 10 n=1 Tax=Apteryx mantelli TaxID=2696672 RepID=A0A8B7JB56_9AVES|nr:PREDICTED: rho GTPase-activating protein 10 isoform X1 [Apteryx mantelli mantelli]XP_025943321.1 rho GTPase-activating protein 10 isoform X2 [Apteryx rowi]